MNDLASPPEPKLYMRNLSVLLVENNAQEQEIVAQILSGFKVRAISRRSTAGDAMTHIQHERADLLIVGAALPEMDGYDFTRWLRFAKAVASRTAPVILLTGHTRATDVKKARDCGASFVVAKPVTPSVLFQRIAWLARDERPFIETEAYTGPDRRFRKQGPPPGMAGRRKDDLSLKVGEATEANMSQAEIDALLNPKGPIR